VGVLYVECKVCCEVKCKCYLRPSRPAMDNAVSPMEDAARDKKKCGCSAGASRYYKYND